MVMEKESWRHFNLPDESWIYCFFFHAYVCVNIVSIFGMSNSGVTTAESRLTQIRQAILRYGGICGH